MTLATIKSSLAAQPVAVGVLTPATYTAATLPNKLDTKLLPCRLIMAGDSQGRSQSGSFVTMGKLTQTTRQMSDVLFWKLTSAVQGRAGVDADLSTYIDNYETMLRSWRNAGQSGAHVLGWTIDIGTINYPQGDQIWYWGVICVTQVQEYISG